MRVVLDTNVLVSFLTNRNDSQRVAARRLLLDAGAGEVAAVFPQFAMFEVAYVLKSVYESDDSTIASSLEAILEMPGVLIVDDCPWRRVLEYWPGSIRSLTDAAFVAVASGGRYDALATFDRKLARRLPKFGVRSYW